MNSEGFQELASILNPAIDIPTGETPLLVAMGAVGKGVCLAKGKFWSLRVFLLETVPLTVIGN